MTEIDTALPELLAPEERTKNDRKVALTDEKIKARHDGVWYWFDAIEECGGWDEYDEPLRRALEEIEQFPNLPTDFIIDYIKEKEGVGLRIEFKNAGTCTKAVEEIRDRVERETLSIMVASSDNLI